MPGKRPINADLPPVAEEGSAPSEPKPSRASEVDHTRGGSKSEARRSRRRQPIPGALKAISGLVLVAIIFLVAAVLGGGGANRQSEETSTPTVQVPPSLEDETPPAPAAEELGIPSIATNNTTRIGGSEPAATAAAVALAVYPSRSALQRPAAVTLVDESKWQDAVAAALLMATPVRAPLLVTTGDDLPDPTSQALEALAPRGSKVTDGAQAFAVGTTASPDLKTTAIEGSSPATTAAALVALRNRLFGEPPDSFVLVSQGKPELAVPAAAWAARSGDPVLFTGTAKLPSATAKVLERHPKVPVHVLGPSAAISSDVFREVAKLGNPVRRVSGENPVENAISFARYASGGFGWNVNDPGHGFVIARSDAPLDAAVAAPLSASGTWGPLLLTDGPDTLPGALREYLLDVKPGYSTDPTRAFYNHVWVIGDQEAIDVNQQAEIDQLAELAKIE